MADLVDRYVYIPGTIGLRLCRPDDEYYRRMKKCYSDIVGEILGTTRMVALSLALPDDEAMTPKRWAWTWMILLAHLAAKPESSLDEMLGLVEKNLS